MNKVVGPVATATLVVFGRPANPDMVEGYMDGFDRDSPEPSENRSRSYRHGFANGRADRSSTSRGMSFEQLHDAAEEAMRLDDLDLLQATNGSGSND